MDTWRIEPEDLKKWDVLDPCHESFLSQIRLICFSSLLEESAKWGLVVTTSDKVYAVGDIPAWALYRETEGVSEPLEIAELSGTGVVGFSCGAEHCLAITGSGGVMSWGDNCYGQLGLGTTESSSVPVQLYGLPQVTSVTCGEYFSLALTQHEVYVWGSSQYGQCCQNSDALRPRRVELPADITPISIACGADHAAVVGVDGKVYCWGSNNVGQLGRGSADNNSHEDLRPVELVSAVSQVCCSGESTVALALDGQVWAWGNNFGRNRGMRDYVTLPKLLIGLRKVTDITSVWTKCSCIARTNSAIFAWGDLRGKRVPDLKNSSSLAGALDNGPTPTLMVRGRSGGPPAEAGSASLVNHCGEFNKPSSL